MIEAFSVLGTQAGCLDSAFFMSLVLDYPIDGGQMMECEKPHYY